MKAIRRDLRKRKDSFFLFGPRGTAENRISILAQLMRLRRYCCHPSLVLPQIGESAKLETFVELLRGLKAGGHHALVFSQFTDYLALARDRLEREGFCLFYFGQRLPVTVCRLICKDTIEEKVVNLHADKIALSEDILADGTSSLSAEAMLGLLST